MGNHYVEDYEELTGLERETDDQPVKETKAKVVKAPAAEDAAKSSVHVETA